MIKGHLVFLIAVLGFFDVMPLAAMAAVCGNGVYNAGCVGPNGAAVVHKPVYGRPAPYYRPPGSVTCVNGVYRAAARGRTGPRLCARTTSRHG